MGCVHVQQRKTEIEASGGLADCHTRADLHRLDLVQIIRVRVVARTQREGPPPPPSENRKIFETKELANRGLQNLPFKGVIRKIFHLKDLAEG